MSINLEIKTIGDINTGKYHFSVPDYQRGYRWTRNEIRRLLKDIPTVNNTDGSCNYCLQPIVTRNKGNNTYELIDGQQRLTSLYIIQKIISNQIGGIIQPQYAIAYDTRDNSQVYLENIITPGETSCQDFWFMSEAADEVNQYITENKLDQSQLLALILRITQQLEVIWYEVSNITDDEAIDLFERLNIGKIPLTNSELVKALFLGEAAGTLSKERAEEISLLWDQMEIQLNDEAFWGFLHASNNREYQTRIDLILDIIAKTPSTEKDTLYTFLHFSDEIDNGKAISDIWREIHDTFMTLYGWYANSDHTIYHLAGYLMGSSLQTLSEIYQLQFKNGARLGQKDFESELKNKIIELLFSKSHKEDKDNYSTPEQQLEALADKGHLLSYSYNKSDDKPFIHRILLLYNMMGEMQADDRKRMFPLSRHLDEKWTLEHIHAQHSELLSNNKQIKNWLEIHIPLIKDRNADKTIISDMENLLGDINNNRDKNTRDRYKAIYDRVWPIFHGQTQEIHNISNLTLLTGGQNSAVSNYIFEAKRNMVSNWDSNGKYIPWGTRRVFFKNFADADASQVNFWSQRDMDAYVDELSNIIKSLL